MLYKGFEIDDNKIDEYVENLEISIAEACDLILEESGKKAEDKETTEAIAKLEKSGAKRHYEKSKTERKPTSKERKVDETKGYLIACTKTLLEGLGATATSVKTETELSFEYEGAKYTFKLTKHRPPKKK